MRSENSGYRCHWSISHNTAYIVFDFNTPVVTNTTFNQVSLTTSSAAVKPKNTLLSIYPNPIASGSDLKIVFDSPDKQALLSVFDVSGRRVFGKMIASSTQTQSIALPLLDAGIYECVISSANAHNHKKLLIATHR